MINDNCPWLFLQKGNENLLKKPWTFVPTALQSIVQLENIKNETIYTFSIK